MWPGVVLSYARQSDLVNKHVRVKRNINVQRHSKKDSLEVIIRVFDVVLII